MESNCKRIACQLFRQMQRWSFAKFAVSVCVTHEVEPAFHVNRVVFKALNRPCLNPVVETPKGKNTMETKFETLQDVIDTTILGLLGRGATEEARKKARLFIGVVAIIVANVWLGPVIGHGIAAILGAASFFVVGLGGSHARKEDK